MGGALLCQCLHGAGSLECMELVITNIAHKIRPDNFADDSVDT